MVSAQELPLVEGRAVVGKRLKPVAVEAIVRGYLVGSGWKEIPAQRHRLRHSITSGPTRSAAVARAYFYPVRLKLQWAIMMKILVLPSVLRLLVKI